MAKYKTPFEAAIARATRLTKKTLSYLNYMQDLAGKGKYIEAYDTGFEAIDSAEKLALLTRSLPAHTGRPSAKSDATAAVVEAVHVDIGFSEQGWFCMHIPLIPPKKDKGSADYIRGYLKPALSAFFRDAYPFRYDNCVLIYRHVFGEDRPEKEYRDHDNFELNAVTDLVALHVMVDDSPVHCSHYYCSAIGVTERTEVYVVPADQFHDWLKAEESFPEEGLSFTSQPTIWDKKDS